MINILYLSLSLCCIFAVIFYAYFSLASQKKKELCFYIEKYESYVIILDYFCKKAYDLIYKDKIMIYSLEATGLNDMQYKVVSKDFCNLVLRFLGPNLITEFSGFFGNDQILMFNIMEYFNTNYEGDKIKEQATENMMGKEIEIED